MADSDTDWTPAVSFYFNVKVIGFDDNYDYAFKEVAGLSAENKYEEIREGGVNDFFWKVPQETIYPNLVLKRGMATMDSRLSDWVVDSIVNDFQKKIELHDIEVSLLNHESENLITWTFRNARPIKWTVSDLDSMKNELLVETLEFCHTGFTVSADDSMGLGLLF
ncbi:hypothetical protein FUAX_18380 [Fulvitalea axinellae]|uniref:Phage tail protein n=1 Tax=Fulvitalea axinellae TaxID=1182444 RepID=A0AAU9CKC4_9BACT|nr:hypothetical protein FUAX_18380 [Fulvitalea axinellae]